MKLRCKPTNPVLAGPKTTRRVGNRESDQVMDKLQAYMAEFERLGYLALEIGFK